MFLRCPFYHLVKIVERWLNFELHIYMQGVLNISLNIIKFWEFIYIYLGDEKRWYKHISGNTLFPSMLINIFFSSAVQFR